MPIPQALKGKLSAPAICAPLSCAPRSLSR
jgi:hypothetical protein